MILAKSFPSSQNNNCIYEQKKEIMSMSFCVDDDDFNIEFNMKFNIRLNVISGNTLSNLMYGQPTN